MSNRLQVIFVLICLVGGKGLAINDKVFITEHEMSEGFLVEATIKVPVDSDHMARMLCKLSASQVISHNGNHRPKTLNRACFSNRIRLNGKFVWSR